MSHKMKLQVLNASDVKVKNGLFRDNLDQHPLWYRYVEPHFAEIGIDMEYLAYSKLDKSKPWILNAQITFWNWKDFTGDILTCFPGHIQDALVNGSAYILMNHEWENHTVQFFELLYMHLYNSTLPPHKIIYLCNGVDVDKLYNEYVIKNNIPKNKRITTIYSPHLHDAIFPSDGEGYFSYDNVPKQKKYLCLNRVGRLHRVIMISLLEQHGVLNEGFVSLNLEPNFRFDANFDDSFVLEGYDKIKAKCPMIVDTPDFETNHVGFTALPVHYYQHSYFSLVTATSAFFSEEPSLSITEKEFKPMAAKHPFILVNKPGTLRHMREFGFMTFDRWFDESYDSEVDDIARMKKIALEVKRLSLLSVSEWDTMRNEMTPVLMHNYNRVVNYASERNYFNADLKKLLQYVS